MSEKITSSQIYLFLAKQGAWQEKADLDGNDEISKGEMREYLSGGDFKNWIGVSIKDVSAKVFDDFWAKLDSKVIDNNLDDTELKNLEATVGNYEKLEQLISKNTPNGVIKNEYIASWNAKMADALIGIVDKYDESCGRSLDELLNEAFPTAYNKATAETLAEQYSSSAAIKSLITGAGIRYDITKDATLTTIVNNYIQIELLKVGNDDKITQLGAADIESKIKNLINSYLKTAGLGNGGDVDVSKYGYDSTQLNDPQNAVILKKISEKLSTERSKFPGYEQEFDEVLNKFVDNYLRTSDITAAAGKSLFDTLVSKLDDIKSAFKNSKDYKNLTNKLTVYDKYRDNLSDEFKEAVKTALGDNADLFLNNCKTSKDYETILQGIIERINSGEEDLMTNGAVDWTKVQAAVIEEVTSLINGASTEAGNLESLQKDFERNSSDLVKAKEKAIKYCDAAKAMGGEYEAAVVKVFGSDHKSAIEAFEDTIALASKMKSLFDIINKIQNLGSIENWTGAEPRTMILGMTQSFQVSAVLDSTIDPSKVTYSAVSEKGANITMKNSANGKFDYTTPSTAGYDTITVTSYYKGEPIASITIQIQVADIDKWANDPSDRHLEVFDGSDAETQVFDSDFATLYKENALIQLERDLQKNSGKWKERLSNLSEMIVSSLSATLDQPLLEQAAKNVVNRYIDNRKEFDRINGHSWGSTYYSITNNGSSIYTYSGVLCGRADDHGHSTKEVNMVSFRQLVDDIIAEYNKLSS